MGGDSDSFFGRVVEGGVRCVSLPLLLVGVMDDGDDDGHDRQAALALLLSYRSIDRSIDVCMWVGGLAVWPSNRLRSI